MTPNFSLSLSFDGIRLLQRTPDGWNLVGEVSLEAPDLPAALADLRASALRLSPDGLRTKLVIPSDQIRFMTLETAQTSLADVRKALEGQTPYALDELVIDFDRHGGRTYIAAVARETLAEAETFAVENNFGPVAFVAVPEPDTFKAEVFFGPARAAGKSEVIRDSRPVIQTGVVELAVSDDPAPAVTDVATSMPPPQTDVSAGSVAKASAEPVFASRARPSGQTDAQPDVSVLPSAPIPGPVKGAAPTAPKADKVPVLASAAAHGQPAAPAKRAAITIDAIKAAPVEPLFTRRKEPPPPAPAKAAAKPVDVTLAQAVAALPAAAPVVSPVANPVATPVKPQRTPVSAPLGRLEKPRGKPRFLGLILTAVLLVVLLLVGLWASTLPPEGIVGWFRGIGGTSETETADATADNEPPVAQIAADSTADVAADTTDIASDLTAETVQEQEIAEQPRVIAEPGQPVVRAPAGRVLSPAEADRIYAATGVYQRAPRLTVTPRTSTLDTLEPVSLIPTPAELPRPAMPVLDAVAPDAELTTPVNPPRADVVFERDENGNILATPRGTVMPDGAVVFAGAPDMRPVARPRSTRPVNPEAADAPDAPTVLPRLRPAGLVPATPPAAAEPAATQTGGQTDGLMALPDAVKVTAGPPPLRPKLRPQAFAERAPPADIDDATAPAVDVALGDVRPKARPGEIAALAPLPPYTGPRPVNRPTSLAPQAVAEAETSAEPEPEAAPVTDINAVAAAIAMAAPPSAFTNRTRLAVSVTPRPDARPRNFAQVVASARAVPAPAAPRTNTVRTAAAVATPTPPTIVAPSGNVPGGVARAATQEDAINLRQMNLVGVYGKPNQRRALVRLGNGRYVKVEVGSSLDGGQVTAIGDSALNFVKRGRTYALVLPAG